MNTVELLQTIGYPTDSQFDCRSHTESPDLYTVARQNKVGSLYLHALADTGNITQLEEEWTERQNYRRNLTDTYRRLSETIPSEIDYAAVKSVYPFVADFKDIDILLFDTELEVLKTAFSANGFDVVGDTPVSFDVIDPETDIQIDVQTNLAVRRVIYLDNASLRDSITETSIDGAPIPKVARPADLAAIITHSVIEQLFILKEFYYAVYALEHMSAAELRRFTEIVDANNIGPICSAFFSVTRCLASEAFHQYPEPIDYLLDRYGVNHREVEAFERSGYAVPHRYSARTNLKTVSQKFQNKTFLTSLLVQLPHLLYPPTLYYLLGQLQERFTRQHYAHERTYD